MLLHQHYSAAAALSRAKKEKSGFSFSCCLPTSTKRCQIDIFSSCTKVRFYYCVDSLLSYFSAGPGNCVHDSALQGERKVTTVHVLRIGAALCWKWGSYLCPGIVPFPTAPSARSNLEASVTPSFTVSSISYVLLWTGALGLLSSLCVV